MHTRLPSALVLALALSAPLAASPRWTSLGPFGGDVEHLTVDPADSQVLYATLGDQGTFKSADRGASWIPVHAGTASGGVAVDPTRHTTIYQTLASGEVLKSTDGGGHWTSSSVPGLQLGDLAVDPAVPTRIYLATNDGVWRSLDGGATWQPGRQPLPPGEARGLTLLALPRPAGTVFAGTGSGLFKSVDGGDSWKPVGQGLHPGAVTALARASQAGALWAGVKDFGVFLSTNGGASWRSTATQPPGVKEVRALAAPPNPAGTAWVSTARGVYRTTDSGAHWAQTPLRPDARVASLAFSGSTLYAGLLSDIFAATGRDAGGILASNDGGTTWRQRSRGLAGLFVELALDPRDPQVLWATAGISGIFRSTVGGFDWGFPSQPPAQVNIDPVSRVLFSPVFSADGSALFVVSAHRLWKTVDDGASWREVGPGQPFFITQYIVADPRDPGTLYVPNGISTLYTSRDAGATWQGQTAPTQCALISLAVAPSNPATLYAGGIGSDGDFLSCNTQRHAALYRSTDGGTTWTKADAGLDAADGQVVSIAVDPSDSRTLYAGAFPSLAVWKSTNGGTTWTGIETGLDLQGAPFLTVSAIDGSIWATDGFQVLVSRNAGATWESVGAPQSSRLSGIVPDPRDADRLYVTGRGGVWLLELDAAAP